MIVVLSPGLPASTLDRLSSACAGRGWHAEVSRGAEQTVMLVTGPTDPDDVRAVFVGEEVDVLPVLEGEKYRRDYHRRRFLSASISGLAVLLVLGLAMPLWAYLRPPERAVVVPEMLFVPGADALAVGEGLVVRAGDARIYVVRVTSERWRAVSGSCTYSERCFLEWSAAEQRLTCPCHGCAFDAYGNVLHAPASIPLVSFQVVESGGKLYIRRVI